MLILFIFLALLIALGLLFLGGKCGFLISGFNAIHGDKENLKENLDEKKLCRYMARLIFLLAGCRLIITVGFAIGIKQIGFLGIILFCASAVAGTVIANTGNRFGK